MSTIGTKIDDLHEMRERKRALEEQVKEISRDMQSLEFELIKQMEAEGVTKSTGNRATVSVNDVVRPTVEDWDAFYAFIHRHRYYHLLERRPSASGCNELFESRGKVPGVVPFTQRKLNIRSV